MNKNYKISNEYLFDHLKHDDHAVWLHINNALLSFADKKTTDHLCFMKAINDVASARGKAELAERAGLSRQGLYKILNGESTPSIQNIMAILFAIGLRFSVEKTEREVFTDQPAAVLDVAEAISILLPRKSTYMKLQKIVYYAQVESLVHYSKPLFKEKILAWRGGPVVRELFKKHKGYKRWGVNKVTFGDPTRLSVEQKSCVKWAVEKYGGLDGDTLSHITHLEDPWKKARKNLPADAPSNEEITARSMLKYYSNLPKYNDLEEQDENY